MEDRVGRRLFRLSAPSLPGQTSAAVAEKLATERGVLCLPGSYFGPGQEGHLRVAFANVGADVLSGLTERFRGLTL